MNMRSWKFCFCLTLVASLVGCASGPDRQPAAASVYVDAAASPPVASLDEVLLSGLKEAPADIEAYPESVDPVSPEFASAEAFDTGVPAILLGPADTEPADGLTAPPRESLAVYDPWERFNRRMHRFNNAVDKLVARPVAMAYVNVVPAPVRSKVGNFFDNLGQPATAVNALLQGKITHSAQAMGRFLVNSTAGVAGLFDPASRLKMPEREEDFGQTLATWGWKRSRYLELPFFGPSTVRDALGMTGDSPLQPMAHVEADKIRIGLQALNLVDMRTRLMAFDSLRDETPDDYLLLRDSWAQRRNFQMKRDTDEDASLPDYLNE
jgi:phospholipid-binding lipoprotein MlaA